VFAQKNGMKDVENQFVVLLLINGMKDLENQPTLLLYMKQYGEHPGTPSLLHSLCLCFTLIVVSVIGHAGHYF
jgi:hypothetical protein